MFCVHRQNKAGKKLCDNLPIDWRQRHLVSEISHTANPKLRQAETERSVAEAPLCIDQTKLRTMPRFVVFMLAATLDTILSQQCPPAQPGIEYLW